MKKKEKTVYIKLFEIKIFQLFRYEYKWNYFQNRIPANYKISWTKYLTFDLNNGIFVNSIHISINQTNTSKKELGFYLYCMHGLTYFY